MDFAQVEWDLKRVHDDIMRTYCNEMVGFDWDFMGIDRDLIIRSSGFNDLTLDFTET